MAYGAHIVNGKTAISQLHIVLLYWWRILHLWVRGIIGIVEFKLQTAALWALSLTMIGLARRVASDGNAPSIATFSVAIIRLDSSTVVVDS